MQQNDKTSIMDQSSIQESITLQSQMNIIQILSDQTDQSEISTRDKIVSLDSSFQNPIPNQRMNDSQSTHEKLNSCALINQNQISNITTSSDTIINKELPKQKGTKKKQQRDQQNSTIACLQNQPEPKKLLFSNTYVHRKKVQYSQYLINKMLYNQKYLKRENKFYIFMDQVIDMEYFTLQESFQQKNQQVQFHKGMRFINQIIHRNDNKYIEVDLEFYPTKVNNIEYLISMLKSIGNSNYLESINQLEIFWKNINMCKILIKQEYMDPLLQQHFEARNLASEQKYKMITSQFNQKEMIYFLRVKPNYTKLLYESEKVGYSPKLYEILAENSYQFKDTIQKNGCYDPRTVTLNIEYCLSKVSNFLYGTPKQNQGQDYHSMNFDIMTTDNFILPVTVRTQLMNLNEEYDSTHNLKFKFKDMIVAHKFEFREKGMEDQLKNYRQQQKQQQQEQILQNNSQDQVKDLQEQLFFHKYYPDSIQDLYKKKFKQPQRCNIVEVFPNKQQFL